MNTIQNKVNNIELLLYEVQEEFKKMNPNQKFDFLVENYGFIRLMNFKVRHKNNISYTLKININEAEINFINDLFFESLYNSISLSYLLEQVKKNSNLFQTNKDIVLKIIHAMIKNTISDIKG